MVRGVEPPEMRYAVEEDSSYLPPSMKLRNDDDWKLSNGSSTSLPPSTKTRTVNEEPRINRQRMSDDDWLYTSGENNLGLMQSESESIYAERYLPTPSKEEAAEAREIIEDFSRDSTYYCNQREDDGDTISAFSRPTVASEAWSPRTSWDDTEGSGRASTIASSAAVRARSNASSTLSDFSGIKGQKKSSAKEMNTPASNTSKHSNASSTLSDMSGLLGGETFDKTLDESLADSSAYLQKKQEDQQRHEILQSQNMDPPGVRKSIDMTGAVRSIPSDTSLGGSETPSAAAGSLKSHGSKESIKSSGSRGSKGSNKSSSPSSKQDLGLVSKEELFEDLKKSGLDKVKEIHQHVGKNASQNQDIIGLDVVAANSGASSDHSTSTGPDVVAANSGASNDHSTSTGPDVATINSGASSDHSTSTGPDVATINSGASSNHSTSTGPDVATINSGASSDHSTSTGLDVVIDVDASASFHSASTASSVEEQEAAMKKEPSYFAQFVSSFTGPVLSASDIEDLYEDEEEEGAKEERSMEEEKKEADAVSPRSLGFNNTNWTTKAEKKEQLPVMPSSSIKKEASPSSTKTVRFSENIKEGLDTPSLMDAEVSGGDQEKLNPLDNRTMSKKKGIFRKWRRKRRKKKHKQRSLKNYKPSLETTPEEVSLENESSDRSMETTSIGGEVNSSGSVSSSESKPPEKKASVVSQESMEDKTEEGFELIAGRTIAGQRAIMIANTKHRRTLPTASSQPNQQHQFKRSNIHFRMPTPSAMLDSFRKRHASASTIDEKQQKEEDETSILKPVTMKAEPKEETNNNKLVEPEGTKAQENKYLTALKERHTASIKHKQEELAAFKAAKAATVATDHPAKASNGTPVDEATQAALAAASTDSEVTYDSVASASTNPSVFSWVFPMFGSADSQNATTSLSGSVDEKKEEMALKKIGGNIRAASSPSLIEINDEEFGKVMNAIDKITNHYKEEKQSSSQQVLDRDVKNAVDNIRLISKKYGLKERQLIDQAVHQNTAGSSSSSSSTDVDDDSNSYRTSHTSKSSRTCHTSKSSQSDALSTESDFRRDHPLAMKFVDMFDYMFASDATVEEDATL